MRTLIVCCFALTVAACNRDSKPDAYGTFEAVEVVVSSETTGQLLTFTPVEGAQIARGSVVALVDTAQLALQKQQVVAQRQATGSRANEVTRQISVLQIQRDVARRNYERTRRLFEEKAATAQQLDQAERDYRVLGAQIEAARAQLQSVAREGTSSEARVAQIGEQLDKSRVQNPLTGTVLATFVHAGEIVQPGQALYRIANLDTLTLRAYISETQLHSIKLGAPVEVRVDSGNDKTIALSGTIAWIASKAEFTPTPIQTRDERADLVYAVKVRVPNKGGLLKIGMPGDITLPSGDSRS
ncbi:MAG TPA: efflux RND transporter periplasmic adaptor subunit [Gemmatimonadaceae bacterium]|nr:efflux RND transporter periplasmic adaptor subunit [Gemmatimonadaceae bacterium]